MYYRNLILYSMLKLGNSMVKLCMQKSLYQSLWVSVEAAAVPAFLPWVTSACKQSSAAVWGRGFSPAPWGWLLPGILCTGLGSVPGGIGTGLSFYSSPVPSDPKPLRVCSYVSLSGICSTKDGWNSSYWHLLWTKSLRSQGHVIRVQACKLRFQKASCNSVLFIFSVKIFPSRKRRSMALKNTENF